MDELKFHDDPKHHKESYYKKKMANHLKKKRSVRVTFFDTDGNSIHSQESVEEFKSDVGIDPHNQASKYQSKSIATSTSEEVPQIQTTVSVPELMKHQDEWIHSNEASERT